MQKNYQQDIGLFSNLIQLILSNRLHPKSNANQLLSSIIEKFQSQPNEKKYDLEFGLKMISKEIQNSIYKVKHLFEKPFKQYQIKNYIIQLIIFEQFQLQFLSFHKKKILQRWIFQRHNLTKNQSKNLTKNQSTNYTRENDKNDLILIVIKALYNQKLSLSNKFCSLSKQTIQRGYQIFLYTQDENYQKKQFIIHSINKQLDIDLFKQGQSMLSQQKKWYKSILFKQYHLEISCQYHGYNIEMTTNSQPINIMRKQSQQTYQSSSSFKLNYSAKQLQKQSGSKRRFHSIYQSKDQEMNVWVLSPRKLSQEDSPKIKYFQQRSIRFLIDQNHGIIQDQIMEDLNLQIDNQSKLSSSSQFEMLQDLDQIDQINQSSTTNLQNQPKQSTNTKLKTNLANMQRLRQQFDKIQKQLFEILKRVDSQLY